MDTKTCKDCNETKVVTDYYFQRNRPSGVCKQCCGARCKKNYEKNRKQAIINAQKRYALKKDEINNSKKIKYHTDTELNIKIKAHGKKYYQENKKWRDECCQKYYQDNKEAINIRKRKWERERLSNDIDFRLKKNLRRRINFALIDKIAGKSTLDIIGCSIQQFRDHIESKFTTEMSWENYGSFWSIDHIIPVSWFNTSNEHCLKAAFNYKNTQPLCKRLNTSKSNRYHDFKLEEAA